MKKIIFLFSVILFTATIAIAQPIRGIPLSEKQNEVKKQEEATNYYYAVKWAKKVRKSLPKDQASLRNIAFGEMMMRDYPAAALAYQELLNNDKKDQAFQEERFYFAKVLKMDGKYKEAKEQFESYAKYGTNANNVALTKIELQGIKLAGESKADPKVIVKNAGTGVNSPYSDVGAVYAGENSNELYYSAIRSDVLIELNPDGKSGGKVNSEFSQLYKSTNNGGTWSSGQALDGAINKLGIHNAHVAISKDGNALYFSRCQLKGTTATCDIYVSFQSGGNWTDAAKIEGGVNGDNFTSKHPALGEINGRTALFFTSNMSGGRGGYDLYYAVQQDGAKFAAPVNVGAPVNTIANEESPFHSDNTLYFSTEGHPGLGGYDVFSAKQSGVSWSGVKNLGATVNSSTDDMYYSLDKTGYKGTVVSNRSGGSSAIAGKSSTCCYDIYTLDYPIPVDVDLEVLAFDEKGNDLSGATLTLIESSDKDVQNNARSNFFSWKDLKRDVTYKVMATKNGYKPAEFEISTAGISSSKTFKEKVTLVEIVVIDLDVAIITNTGKKLTGATVTLEEIGASGPVEVTNNPRYRRTGGADKSGFSWKDLKKGTKYRITASKDQYGSASQEFTTEGVSKTIVLKEKLSLVEPVIVSKDRPLRLPGINFDLGKHAIRADAEPQLNKLLQLLTDFPAITKIQISAHTDAQGRDLPNQRLSQRRADSAVRYLVSKGIAPSRLVAKGYGESKLTNQCGNGVKCSDAEHEQNRRVEFSILEGPSSVPANYILEGVTGEERIKKN